MISFKNVTKTYDTNIALKDVSIDIAQGEFVFLVGPSGAGKSTFIKLLLHEIVPDEGSIMVQKKEVTKLPSRLIPIHRRNLGIVFQNFREGARRGREEVAPVGVGAELVPRGAGRGEHDGVPEARQGGGRRDGPVHD